MMNNNNNFFWITLMVAFLFTTIQGTAAVPINLGNEKIAPTPPKKETIELVRRADTGMMPPVFNYANNYSPAVYDSPRTPAKKKMTRKLSAKNMTKLVGQEQLQQNHKPSIKPKQSRHQPQQQNSKPSWSGMGELRRTMPRTKSANENWWEPEDSSTHNKPLRQHRHHH